MSRGLCSIAGCIRPHYARSWCATHYAQWRKTGDPLPRRRRGRGVCSIDGCDAPQNARGWCNTHYKRWRRHGDPEAPDVRPICAGCVTPMVDTLILGGLSTREVASITGLTFGQVTAHRHSHVPHVGAWVCATCAHPDVDEIDALLERRSMLDRLPTGPHPLSCRSIGDRFGLSKETIMRHAKPGHQERRARYELARLAAIGGDVPGH